MPLLTRREESHFRVVSVNAIDAGGLPANLNCSYQIIKQKSLAADSRYAAEILTWAHRGVAVTTNTYFDHFTGAHQHIPTSADYLPVVKSGARQRMGRRRTTLQCATFQGGFERF